MQAMTNEQRNYMLQRLDEITQDKLEAKRTELSLDGCGPKPPTWGEVFEAIRTGECTLKEETVYLRRPYLNPSDVNWPKLDEMKAEYEANVQALQDYKEQLQRERKKVMDKFMLAGVEGAAEALEAYAKV